MEFSHWWKLGGSWGSSPRTEADLDPKADAPSLNSKSYIEGISNLKQKNDYVWRWPVPVL
jgi:hypothetical protein